LSRRDLWEPEGETPSGYPTKMMMMMLRQQHDDVMKNNEEPIRTATTLL
jgi:hypothetical protein